VWDGLQPTFDMLPQLLKGAAVTLQITVLTAPLVIVLSFAVAFARMAKNRYVRLAAGVYVEVLRGVSAVVLLFYLFFIFPVFGVRLGTMTTAVLGLGFNLSAYGSEIVRAAIQSIDERQKEGGAALGLTRFQILRLVIIPQAVLVMLPSMGNLLIELIKATSLVSLITLTELTFSGRQMVVTTGRFLEVWVLVLLLYFAMAYPLSRLVLRAERHAARFR